MKKSLTQVWVWGTLLAVLMSAFWATPLEASTNGAGAVYTAPLSGGEEVPARTTPGSGQAEFQVSADGQSLTYTVTVSNMTNVTMGHIHIGAKGTNGDIVLPLVPTAPPAGGPRSGTIGQGTAVATQLVGPMQGKTMADLIAQIDAGNAYVNIHTASGASPATLQPGDIPPGEIRGQIVPTVAPTTMPSTGGGYGSRPSVLPWAALAAILTLGLTALLRARRRTPAAPRTLR
jgi:hypothetical protein